MSLALIVFVVGILLLSVAMSYVTLHCIRCHKDPTFYG